MAYIKMLVTLNSHVKWPTQRRRSYLMVYIRTVVTLNCVHKEDGHINWPTKMMVTLNGLTKEEGHI